MKFDTLKLVFMFLLSYMPKKCLSNFMFLLI